MQNLVSIDIKAQFGFLKKPDINDGIYLTYNMLHKPALLGILGAICGLKGYNIEGSMDSKDIPEYRVKFENLKITVQPLNSQNGNFAKDVIKYTNTVGYASAEQGGVLIIDEQTLIHPSYRIYLLLDTKFDHHGMLLDRLKNYEAEYIPYLGKNDHQLWWENFQEWEILELNFEPNDYFRVDSMFEKPSDEKLEKNEKAFSLTEEVGSFMYFERLPKGWQPELPHYEMAEFLISDYPVSPENELQGLMKIQNEQGERVIIQVF